MCSSMNMEREILFYVFKLFFIPIIHYLLNCKLISLVWSMCDKWVNLTSVYHNQIIQSYNHLYSVFLNVKQNAV